MRPFRPLGVVVMLALLLAGAASSHAAPEFQTIEIRLVAQEPGDGAARLVEGDAKAFHVEPETLLGPSDFSGVGDVERVEGKPGFNVALTPAGAAKYERISAENVGRTLAIIVDGKVLMTPRILDPVRAQGFLLTVNSEAEAKDLAAKVRQVVAQD
ncbi:MAG: SecDF P1 head subdomain-containing protein [Methyloligella sp. ZOD6]